MKNYLMICLYTVLVFSAFSQAKFNSEAIQSRSEESLINQYDTVYFDLKNASTSAGYIQIPVFFRSDDVINSLDFAFRFNLKKLQYDSIIVFQADINPVVNYNSSDSTLRLTSFSTQQIPNDTKLLGVRFKLLNGATQVLRTDFNWVSTLLNGDSCTAAIIENDISVNLETENWNSQIELFPNPSHRYFIMSTVENEYVQISTLEGKTLMEFMVKAGERKRVYTEHIPTGIYLISTIGNGLIRAQRKLIIF